MYKIYYGDLESNYFYRNCVTFNNLKYLIEYMEELNGIENIIIYIEY